MVSEKTGHLKTLRIHLSKSTCVQSFETLLLLRQYRLVYRSIPRGHNGIFVISSVLNFIVSGLISSSVGNPGENQP